MKKILLLVMIVHVAGVSAQMNVKSGLLLGGGRISSSYDVLMKSWNDKGEIAPKFDAGVGYRFRLQPEQKKIFVDLDLSVGMRVIRSHNYTNYYSYQGETEVWLDSREDNVYVQFAFSPTLNYNFFDGWYAGLGVEPTVYAASNTNIINIKTEDKTFSGFDIPVTARLGYDFKYVDVAFSYKYGLCNVLTPDYFSGGKVRCWQLQVFIPF